MQTLTGRRYDSREYVRITFIDEQIAEIAPVKDDASLPWIAPGLIDLQVNGYEGVSFNDPHLDAGGVEHVTHAMLCGGVTKYLPTCTTDSFERLARSFKVLAIAINESPFVAKHVPGFHLEGPYICAEDGPRGAHPGEHVRRPNWDEFQRLQEAAQGKILLNTLSPEYEEAPRFIERAVQSGVVVAIGHANSNGDQIRAAVDAGAKLSTHLGNGAHPQIRRHPNYIWEQLAEDRLTASLITDGHHLPPAVVKSMVRAKTPERIVLVSDVTDRGGMPPGRYSTALGDVEVLEDGRLVVAGQRDILAGASQLLLPCVRNVMKFAGVDLKTAIEMSSVNPARLMGWEMPDITVGSSSTLITLPADYF